MNLFIGMGSIEKISEIKISKTGSSYVNFTLWTNKIGLYKEDRNVMVICQAFDDIAYELCKINENFLITDNFIVFGSATIANNFKGISIQKIEKINNESEIKDFFEKNIWKIF